MKRPEGMSWRDYYGHRRLVFLWGEIYRGVQVYRKFIGWTNPKYKKKGW